MSENKESNANARTEIKTIDVGAYVYFNKENPTPSRTDREIAINVLPANEDSKKVFENFVLAIDNHEQCCEDFGVGYHVGGFFTGDGTLESLGIVYLHSIELDVDLEETSVLYYDVEEEQFITHKDLPLNAPYYAVRFMTDKVVIYAWVYNDGAPYYAHHIYHTNDTLKLDIIEKTL